MRKIPLVGRTLNSMIIFYQPRVRNSQKYGSILSHGQLDGQGLRRKRIKIVVTRKAVEKVYRQISLNGHRL